MSKNLNLINKHRRFAIWKKMGYKNVKTVLFKNRISKLLFNHLDAWGMALIFATSALVIHQAINFKTITLLIAITMGYWLAFAINDYYDTSFDSLDESKAKGNFFVHYSGSTKTILFSAFVLVIILFFCFLQFGLKGVLILALSFFIMWAYSAPPLHFKSRPGLDLIVHAFFVETFPYFICLLLIEAIWTKLDVTILMIAFLASLSAQLEQQIRDFEVDSKTITNFTTTFGIATTNVFLKVVTLLLIIIFLVNVSNGTIPLFLSILGLMASPALIHRFIRKPNQPRSEKIAYISITIALLYTGTIFIYSLLA